MAVPADDRVLRRDARALRSTRCRARLVSSRPLRALVAFLGAQPALLFSYSLWSGIKELAAAALIALVCASVAATIGRWQSLRADRTGCCRGRSAASRSSAPPAVSGSWHPRSSCSPSSYSPRAVVVRYERRSLSWALIAVLSIPSISIARSFISGATGGEITIEHGGRQPRTPAGQPPGLRHLAGDRLPQPLRTTRRRRTSSSVSCSWRSSLGVAARLAPDERWGMPLYLATGVGGFLLRPRPRPRRPELAVAERQGDGRGVAGAGRRWGRRRRGALRDGAPHRGGGDRRCDRGRRPVVERSRVLERLARAARAAGGAAEQSAIASPARARR